MTRGSHPSLDLLYKRAREPRVFFKFTSSSRSKEIREACSKLENEDPHDFLPPLAYLFWLPDPELREAASPVIVKLAEKLPIYAWPKTDEDLREYGLLPNDNGKHFVTDAAWVITAACHRNGHLREKAIGLLGIVPQQVAGAILLIRLNDWVEPVRLRAEEVLEHLLGSFKPKVKMSLVPLAERLGECGRHRNPEIANEWLQRISHRLDEASWLEAWKSCLPRDRRTYINVLKNSGLIPGSATCGALLRSNDRSALFWYIRTILPQLGKTERLAAVEVISKSRAIPIRREWLGFLVENTPEEAVKNLTVTLLDPSKSLRSFARFHLERLAPMDFVAHYYQSLREKENEAVSLIALAELSPAEAQSEVIPRLQSSTFAIRKAAIQAMDDSSIASHLDWLLDHSESDAPGIAKVCRKRLSENPGLLGIHLLKHPHQFTQFSIPLQAFILRRTPFLQKWIALELLLRWSVMPHLKEELIDSLRIWSARINRSAARLPYQKRDELLSLLKTSSVAESSRKFLQFVLNNG